MSAVGIILIGALLGAWVVGLVDWRARQRRDWIDTTNTLAQVETDLAVATNLLAEVWGVAQTLEANNGQIVKAYNAMQKGVGESLVDMSKRIDKVSKWAEALEVAGPVKEEAENDAH